MRRVAIIALIASIMFPLPAAAKPTSSCDIPKHDKLSAQVFANFGGSQDYSCEYQISIAYQDGTQGTASDHTDVSAGGTNRPVLEFKLTKAAKSCAVTQQNCTPK